LLNELLQRLKRVMKEKINYGVLDENQRKIREDSNHLLRFVDERVAEAPGEFIFLNELHTELLGWYETEGYANINKDLSSVHPKVDDLRSNLDKKYDPLVSSIVRFKQTLEKLGINLEFRKEKNSNRELRWTLVDKRIR
jgi:phage/plasmid-associated DNA primase